MNVLGKIRQSPHENDFGSTLVFLQLIKKLSLRIRLELACSGDNARLDECLSRWHKSLGVPCEPRSVSILLCVDLKASMSMSRPLPLLSRLGFWRDGISLEKKQRSDIAAVRGGSDV